MLSYKYFLLSFLLLWLQSCSEKSDNAVNPRHYPVDMNSVLEYTTTLYIQYYDSSGNLLDPESILTDYSEVHVMSNHDSLGNYNNLYLLISFDKNFPFDSSKRWYLDSDSGFYAIAYSTPGSIHNVLPKRSCNSVVDYIRSKLQLVESPYFDLNNYSGINDSIYFYQKPVLLFLYPLLVGSRWIESNEFMKIERVISDYKKIDVPAGSFRCYEIKRIFNDLTLASLSSSEYVDLNIGLIKRQVIADSMLFIFEPEDSLRYFKFTSVSELSGQK